MTGRHGVHECTSIFYGQLTDQGDIGFRPRQLGRFQIKQVVVHRDLVEVITEGGTVRIHPSQVSISHS